MKTLLYTICSLRGISIPQRHVPEFLTVCRTADVHPSGGAYLDGKVSYTLPNPITDAEARVIAGHYGLLGEYEYCRDTKHMTPIEALAEWDLLDCPSLS